MTCAEEAVWDEIGRFWDRMRTVSFGTRWEERITRFRNKAVGRKRRLFTRKITYGGAPSFERNFNAQARRGTRKTRAARLWRRARPHCTRRSALSNGYKEVKEEEEDEKKYVRDNNWIFVCTHVGVRVIRRREVPAKSSGKWRKGRVS